MPATVPVVEVELSVFNVLLATECVPLVGADPAKDMPVTLPAVAVEDKLVTVLLVIESGEAYMPDDPILIPVITPCPVILLIVLFVIELGFPQLTSSPVIALVPPVQLAKVLPLNCFKGVELVPSVLAQPAKVVAPVTVILEKLLLLF